MSPSRPLLSSAEIGGSDASEGQPESRSLAEVRIGDAVGRLLSATRVEDLENLLAVSRPWVAGLAVRSAPSLEQKTALLWAMEDRQRREVLDFVPPALVGALIQNLEDENRYLLGDLTLEQYRSLLRLCSPERRLYWIRTALTFTDARANLLPLMLPTAELVDILVTQPEFEEHCRGFAEFPIEDARISGDAMDDPAQSILDLLGPEQVLLQFPVQDQALEDVLRHLLEFDIDRYADLIREGLRVVDYRENQPLEWETISEAPVLLRELEPIPVLPDDLAVPVEPEGDPEPPLALVPVRTQPLVRLARALPAALRSQVVTELQEQYVRQVIAEGGSFLREELEQAARRVDAFLLLGTEGESGGRPEREAAVLAHRPLAKIAQSGARRLERIRQPALRMQPLLGVLGPDQRALVRSLIAPRLTLDAVGRPCLELLPGDALPEQVNLAQAERLLQDAALWLGMARGLGIEATERALATHRTLQRVQEELAIGAVLFGRLEHGLTEPYDRLRFRRQYCTPSGHVRAAAEAGVRRAVEEWNRGRELNYEEVVLLLVRALERSAAVTVP
jgi:hypothetical protein